jgi:bacterioferritin
MFEQQVRAANLFLNDVNALRARAGHCLQAARGRDGGPEVAISLLQTVLAAEIVCVLRYTMISVSQDGLKNAWIGAEFQEQANDERNHMAMAAQRIEQLGGTPEYNPEGLALAATALAGGGDFAARLAENLAAEQGVVEHYRDLIGYFAARDEATCALLEAIIRDEENHARDMQDLLGAYIG